MRGSAIRGFEEGKPPSFRHDNPTGPLHPVLVDIERTIEEDASLFMGFHQMFKQIPDEPKFHFDPTGKPQVRSYKEMLHRIQAILTQSPEFGDPSVLLEKMIPVPINAMLNWPNNTPAGRHIFRHPVVNTHFKKILDVWAEFLSSPESRYILTDNDPRGWFTPSALAVLTGGEPFDSLFACDRSQEHFGFASWDDFFTRQFRPGARPVASPQDDSIVVSPCKATPYKISSNVQYQAEFWIKEQPYSISHLLHSHSLTSLFIGGTVYQAGLSATSYHRWHSPVSGQIIDISHVPGTYYATSPALGFTSAALGKSQGYISHLATRMIVFIRAVSEPLGVVAFVAVGMAAASSCEATVRVGEDVRKGDQLGMFHYGGSSFCLVFRRESGITFNENVFQSLEGQKVVQVNSALGLVL
ncbi:hypothetical protein NP233_g1174 [Leucocoprinus birnbaumii]|uniref:L-tryptophan decarboxylase PsiD-like domain-containing protein n=1 Tax=Leucocoprinus birnbaumii TaxID=56174 RepID=A0AAD5W2R7_9AGAR|nr:hypothetical protein NP233_g1174 [Leucocoprinus birnbaumii]